MSSVIFTRLSGICDILRDAHSCVISDSTYPTTGMLHPRVYGTYTTLLEHFVREKQVLSIEAAVHKCTGRAAKVMGLKTKGVLTPGMAYQYLIVIFLGIPFTLMYNYLSSVLRSVGDSRTPFLFLAFSACLNIILDLAVGDKVNVISGPLASFTGEILELNEEAQKAKVRVSMFGRETEVELDFIQLDKIKGIYEA